MGYGLSFGWLKDAAGAIAHGAAMTVFLIACTTVLGILEDWDAASARCKAAAAKAKSGGTPLAQAKLLKPVRWPSAIYCAGANFTDHMLEMAKVQNIAPEPDPKSVIGHHALCREEHLERDRLSDESR